MNSPVGPPLSQSVRKLAQRQAATCRLFSNPQRVLILWLLADSERSVSEIAMALGSSLSGASQHLRRLELGNAVESRREHQRVYYRLADQEILKTCPVLTRRPGPQARTPGDLAPVPRGYEW